VDSLAYPADEDEGESLLDIASSSAAHGDRIISPVNDWGSPGRAEVAVDVEG